MSKREQEETPYDELLNKLDNVEKTPEEKKKEEDNQEYWMDLLAAFMHVRDRIYSENK
jgi:hypothetical protein